MITEEQIKKAASKILGEENKDWFFDNEVYSEGKIKEHAVEVWVQCKHCHSYRFCVFDLRENNVDSDRIRKLKPSVENKI